MYQKDYILRMIEMLGDLLRAIFGMIKTGEMKQAQKHLSEAYLTMLRKDSSFFQNIPEDKITTTLLEDHNYTDQHLEILAELMYAEAELNFAGNKKNQSATFYRKSLSLFEYVDKNYRIYSEARMDKIKKIKERLNVLRL